MENILAFSYRYILYSCWSDFEFGLKRVWHIISFIWSGCQFSFIVFHFDNRWRCNRFWQKGYDFCCSFQINYRYAILFVIYKTKNAFSVILSYHIEFFYDINSVLFKIFWKMLAEKCFILSISYIGLIIRYFDTLFILLNIWMGKLEN